MSFKSKKKILFCLRDFNHGGIPSCLLQLLRLFDHERYEVEIYCGDQSGVYKEPFKEFNVLPQDALMWLLMSNYRKLFGWKKWAAIAVKITRHGLRKLGFDLYDWYISRTAQKLSGRGVDIAISFAEGFPCQLVSLIKVPKRLTWVHCEYDWVSPCEDIEQEEKRYAKFDKIVCVANRTKDAFCSVFPSLLQRTCVIHNVMDVERIKNMANDTSLMDERFFCHGKKILSVGRVCWQKNFEIIPHIAKKLPDGITWFILGSGPDNETAVVSSEIRKSRMGHKVIMLGATANPYCYMKCADALVVTSRYESYPTIVNEAKIVGTPVVCRNFSSADEIMGDGCGYICSDDRLHEGIITMLSNVNIYNEIKYILSGFEYDNDVLLNSIYTLIDAHE